MDIDEDEQRTPRRFLVASGGYETQIKIHDQDATLVRTLQFPDVQVLHLAFSGGRSSRADARLLLAVGGSPKIGVYDISPDSLSPAPFFMYDLHTAAITSVGFEPHASEFLYSASEDGTLQVWVPVAGAGAGGVAAAAASGANRRATLRTYLNTGAGSALVAINDAVLHPTRMYYFTVDAAGRLRVWDHNAPGGADPPLATHVPHESKRRLQCLDLSADGTLCVAANLDGLVFIYRVADLLPGGSAAIPAVIKPSDSYVTRVRLSHSTNLLACPLTSGIKVFRMRDIALDCGDSVQHVAPVQLFGDRPGWIWDASFVGDSEDYLVACSSNTTVRLWDLKNFSNSREFPSSRKAVVCLAVKELLDELPDDAPREPEVIAISPPHDPPLHQIHHAGPPPPAPAPPHAPPPPGAHLPPLPPQPQAQPHAHVNYAAST